VRVSKNVLIRVSHRNAELQELVLSSSDYIPQTRNKMLETVLPFMFKVEWDNDGETQEVTT